MIKLLEMMQNNILQETVKILHCNFIKKAKETKKKKPNCDTNKTSILVCTIHVQHKKTM